MEQKWEGTHEDEKERENRVPKCVVRRDEAVGCHFKNHFPLPPSLALHRLLMHRLSCGNRSNFNEVVRLRTALLTQVAHQQTLSFLVLDLYSRSFRDSFLSLPMEPEPSVTVSNKNDSNVNTAINNPVLDSLASQNKAGARQAEDIITRTRKLLKRNCRWHLSEQCRVRFASSRSVLTDFLFLPSRGIELSQFFNWKNSS